MAFVIDGIVLLAINFMAAMVFSLSSSGDPGLAFLVFSVLASMAYFTIMESSEEQGTVGKLLTGIKVGDQSGNKISLERALGRHLAKILSTLVLLAGYIMAGIDSRKQALHDRIAATYVYYNN